MLGDFLTADAVYVGGSGLSRANAFRQFFLPIPEEEAHRQEWNSDQNNNGQEEQRQQEKVQNSPGHHVLRPPFSRTEIISY